MIGFLLVITLLILTFACFFNPFKMVTMGDRWQGDDQASGLGLEGGGENLNGYVDVQDTITSRISGIGDVHVKLGKHRQDAPKERHCCDV